MMNKGPEMMELPSRMIPPARSQVFAMEGYYVWGASVLKDESGLFHMFACRWPIAWGINSWYSHSDIVRAVGRSPEGPFEYQETLSVLKEHDWSRSFTIGPNAFEFDGKYYLLYVGSHLPEGAPEEREAFMAWRHQNRHVIRFNQRIGLASAPHPAGPWEPVSDGPVLEPRPDKWDAPFVTNPVICFTPENKTLLLYKSSTERSTDPNIKKGDKLMFGMAMADRPEGPYTRVGPEPLFEENVEDACFWYEDGRWWMICKDMTGNIGGDRYGAGLLYTSPDALHWQEADNIVAWKMWIDWADGERQPIYKMEKPTIYFENGRPVCLFMAVVPTGEESKSWNLARLLK